MKILYVSQYFPPEMGAPSARASELARHWVEAGHEVTVLTGFPNHPTGVLVPEYRTKIWRGVVRENYYGVKIVRTWLWPLPNRKAYERMLNYVSFCVSAAVTGSLLQRPDVVIASSPQLLVGPAGWWISACKRVPFVFEVRDLWPESLVAVGMGRTDSRLYRWLASLAGFLYWRAQLIAVVTPAFKEHLIREWKVAADKIAVIENGVETEMFSPEAGRVELGRKLHLEDKFVVCYIGTMGMAHGLNMLVEAATRLQSTRQPIQHEPEQHERAAEVLFLLVGEGADKERIQKLIAERRLTNILMVDQQPREKIPGLIAASDVALVLLRKDDLFRTVIPTKMLEFMACGRPVIVAVDGEARRIVEAGEAGIYTEPENMDQLIAAMAKLQADPQLRQRMGQSGRSYIEKNFSRKKKSEEYVEALRKVIASPTAE